MESIKDMKKMWMGSLSFLDNCYINAIIVIILLLYSSTIFENINNFIGNLYSLSIIKVIVLLLIVYVTPKDPTIGILLGLSYIVSLHFSQVNHEKFTDKEDNNDEDKEKFFPLMNVSEQKENFFPGVTEHVDANSFDPSQKHDTPSNCMKEYTPKFEAVGNVCEPVATFKNEFNAQGLNFPEGFDTNVVGSVL